MQAREPGALSVVDERSVDALCGPRLTPADKTIKLWKVFEKTLKVVSENNALRASADEVDTSDFRPAPSAPPRPHRGATPSAGAASMQAGGLVPGLSLPRMTYHDTIVAAVPRKIYANAHAYHINSISINSDGETYMSADDLRINLWNLNIADQSFSASAGPASPWSSADKADAPRTDILDIKPANMEELTEVITAAEFHPIS